MLFDTAVETLKASHDVLTTVIEDGYVVDDEIAKFNGPMPSSISIPSFGT